MNSVSSESSSVHQSPASQTDSHELVRKFADDLLRDIRSGKSFEQAYETARGSGYRVSFPTEKEFSEVKGDLPAELSDLWKVQPHRPILRERNMIVQSDLSNGMFLGQSTEILASKKVYYRLSEGMEAVRNLERGAKMESIQYVRVMDPNINMRLATLQDGDAGKVILGNGATAIILRTHVTPAKTGINRISVMVFFDVPYGQRIETGLRDRVYARMKAIREKLKKGMLPKELFNSEFTNTTDGRFAMETGVQDPDILYPKMKAALISLQPGEVSDILEEDSGFFLYRRESGPDVEIPAIASYVLLTLPEHASKKADMYVQQLQGEGVPLPVRVMRAQYLFLPFPD